MKMLNLNRGFYGLLVLTASVYTSALVACSDGGANDVGPTAGGVTDIGNSIASGIVLDVDGAPVKGARVVAYYDSWTQASIKDSVETLSDEKGKYELNVDSASSYMLFASSGDDCGMVLASSGESDSITVGPRRAYSGQISTRRTGTVRIVGSDVTTSLDGDGYFIFYDMPRGDIVITYVDTLEDSSRGDLLRARIQFTTDGNKSIYVLPKMDFMAQDSSWLAVDRMDYYREDGYDGIHILGPVDTTAMDTASVEDENLVAYLAMDGSEKVFDNDSTEAAEVEYVDGVSGKAILLKQGQFIDLDSLDPSAGDFTISLWTKWNGPNGEHQILASQRAYWSDSTSRFQWHFEGNNSEFVILKSQPAYPEGFAFGDASLVPEGEWANLVLVSKDHMVSMYVNGEVVAMTDEDGNEVTAREFVPNDLDRKVPLRIGGNEIDSETWNGALDEIRIESIARDSQWIKEQYRKMKLVEGGAEH